jgi:iron complex outermembrane receptor protein
VDSYGDERRTEEWEMADRFTFRMAQIIILLSVSAGPLLTGAARAEDFTDELRTLSIEELLDVDVVYGASKFEQKTADAPASVTIIRADEIRQMGYRTLGEVLDGVRGFYVTWDRNYAYVGSRGFNRPGDYNTRLLFMIDGQRLTEDAMGSAEVDQSFPLDLDMIERIEVIRGPGSVLYGTSALFGVVNVVTRQGDSAGEREIAAAMASYDTYEGTARMHGRVGESATATVAGSFYRSGGQDLYYREFDTPATNRGWAVGADGDRADRGFAKVSIGRLKVMALASSRVKHVPTASYESAFNDSDTRTQDTAKLVAATYEHRLPADIALNGRLSYLDYVYKGWYTYEDDEAASGTEISRDGSLGRSVTSEVQLSRILFNRHHLMAGVEYRYAPHQDQYVYWGDDLELDIHLTSGTWGTYLQEEFRPGSGFIISAGARYDHYKDFGGTLNPRLAAIWNPSPFTGVKVLYGKAFRAPNGLELYYEDGGVTQKAPDRLNPERMQSIEVTADQRVGENVFLTVSGFSYRMKDLITLTTDPQDDLLVYENGDRVKSTGTEIELRRMWTSGVTGRLSYGFQETRDDQTGALLSNAPKHMMKALALVPLLPGLKMGVDVRYTGSRRTVRGGTAEGYVTTNLTLGETTLIPRLDLTLSVYNLFDAAYAHPASEEHAQEVIAQDRRNIRLRASYGF